MAMLLGDSNTFTVVPLGEHPSNMKYEKLRIIVNTTRSEKSFLSASATRISLLYMMRLILEYYKVITFKRSNFTHMFAQAWSQISLHFCSILTYFPVRTQSVIDTDLS